MNLVGRHMQCPYCNGRARLSLRARDWNRRVSDMVFDYYECSTCGLLFLANVPDDLATYYPVDYYYFPGLAELAKIAEAERFKLDIVRAFAASGRLVEIGPGGGGFALLAKRAGFEVTAIEINPRVCAFLRDVVDVAVIETRNELESLRESGPADVIALWQVIEHLRRPWELIRVAAESLRSGGILVLGAPNPHSLQRRLLGRHWVHLDAPRHIALMPADLVERIGRGVGLDPVLRTTLDRGSRGWNEFGWRFAAKNAVARLSARMPLLSKAAQAAGIGLSRAIARWEDREGVGTAYTIVLRKHT
jgi:2-polyprenyl-3-methyl-5-hydroxy-6-metoxy-1,4-benzoquinol methylase